MGVEASAVLPLLASCELKWGLSSIIGVGGSLLDSSLTYWLSRTGILTTLPPPTTGILLSPEALTDVGFFSLGGCCSSVRGS